MWQRWPARVEQKVNWTMATLTDIKAQLDGLKTVAGNLETFATTTAGQLTSVQAQLAALQAESADPAALQAISDEITEIQNGLAAVIPAAPTPPPAA